MLQLAGTWVTQDTYSSTDSTECALSQTPEAPESRENPSRICTCKVHTRLHSNRYVGKAQLCDCRVRGNQCSSYFTLLTAPLPYIPCIVCLIPHDSKRSFVSHNRMLTAFSKWNTRPNKMHHNLYINCPSKSIIFSIILVWGSWCLLCRLAELRKPGGSTKGSLLRRIPSHSKDQSLCSFPEFKWLDVAYPFSN